MGQEWLELAREALSAIGSWLGAALALEWVKVAIFAGIAAFVGTYFGARLSRARGSSMAASADGAAPVAVAQAGRRPSGTENPALASFQRTLEAKGIPAKDQDTRTRDFARQLNDLRRRLQELSSANGEVAAALDEARRALAEGAFDRVVERLDIVGERDGKGGGEMRTEAEKRLMTAVWAKVIAGDLHLAQIGHVAAERCYREALAWLPQGRDEELAELLNKHGTAAYQAGDHAAATASFERALTVLERIRGESHPDVATALNNLALIHYSQGNYAAAEPLYERALAIDEVSLGEDSTGVATDLNNLALLYKKQGNFEAAAPLLKRALAIKEKLLDPGHPSLVTGLKNYAALLRAVGNDAEAAALEARAAQIPPKRPDAG